MRIVNANKNFEELKNKFSNVIIDLGTGDGRFVYKTAKENPQKLVIGVDPSHKQLEIYAKKANKDRLENALFVVGAVEELPKELIGLGSEVYVNFPWGSLLSGVARANEKVIANISSIVKTGGNLQITFGYSQEAEPSETERLGLNDLSQEKINTEIIPEFEKSDLHLIEEKELQKEDLFGLETTWGKKLSFGNERPVFQLVFIKNKP